MMGIQNSGGRAFPDFLFGGVSRACGGMVGALQWVMRISHTARAAAVPR